HCILRRYRLPQFPPPGFYLDFINVEAGSDYALHKDMLRVRPPNWLFRILNTRDRLGATTRDGINQRLLIQITNERLSIRRDRSPRNPPRRQVLWRRTIHIR